MSEWARPDELEVFATGSTLLVDADDPEQHSAVGEIVRRAADEYHARPGFRPGEQIATTSGRRSGVSDIVRPVLVDPRRATAAASSGALFGEPIPGLDVDRSAAAVDGNRLLVWAALLSGDHVTSMPVSLHLLASPSMVVTVLELVPQRRVRWNRDGFVSDGIGVIERLAARLIEVVARADGPGDADSITR